MIALWILILLSMSLQESHSIKVHKTHSTEVNSVYQATKLEINSIVPINL